MANCKTHFGIDSNKFEEIRRFLVVWESRAEIPTSETFQGCVVVTSKKGFHDWGYLTDVGKYIFFFFAFDRTN